MNDMRAAIIPKSDQLNADDLLTGPITIKVTGVTVKGGQEQPVSVHYEGDDGKPYKPCKSMSRALVTAWGPDSSKYVGRSMTLYCDPKVKWAGMEVGGIRVSHMSDIDSTLTMALTATKGNKKPFIVKPLTVETPIDYAATIAGAATLDELAKAWAKVPKSEQTAHVAAKDARKAELSKPVTDSFVSDMEAEESAPAGRAI